MKVLYDHQAFGMQRFGGVSNCFVKLIENLPKDVNYEIALKESENIHLYNSSLNFQCNPLSFPVDNFLTKHPFRGKRRLYDLLTKISPRVTSEGKNRIESIKALKRGDFDIFHPTFYDSYFLPYLENKPFVLTVHDMIPELFFKKKDFQIKEKPILCKRASHIIAVSDKTKHDLVEILNIPESKVTVIYHGAPENYVNQSHNLENKERYILYVGQRQGYKCFLPMINFLKSFLHRHEEVNIICAGPSFTRKEYRYICDLGLKNRVRQIFVGDLELRELYANAFCFIYPSLYEGFGIPILEAYSTNCPVLLNNRSCFPEIAKDAAIYFDLDYYHSDLDLVMEKVLNMSEEERSALLNKQQQRLVDFSWRKSAEKLANIYASVLNKY